MVVQSLINEVIGAAAPSEARGQPVRVVGLLRLAERKVPARFRGRPIAEAAFRRALAEGFADMTYYDDAEQQILRAVALRTRFLGSRHPETIEAQAYQVRVLGKLGITHRSKQEEGIRLAGRVVEAQRRLLSVNHPDTLSTQCVLGELYLQHGDFQEAIRVLSPTATARARLLGAEDSKTLATLHSLGEAYHGVGQLEAAETTLRHVAEAQQRVIGKQDPESLQTLKSLALVRRDQGRSDQAVVLLREVIAGTRANHGTPYFHGARALCGELVEALRDEGDWAGIRVLCEDWLRELLALPPEPDSVVRTLKAVTLSCMAYWLSTLPADVPFDGGLALRAARLAAETGDNVRDNNYTRLALVCLRLGRTDLAEHAVRESISHHQGESRFDWVALALVRARLGDMEQARAFRERAERGDDGDNAPGVGFARARAELASLMRVSPASAAGRYFGPSQARNEGSPLPR
jgi:tetratricopeptide (TPR) repeat protein